MPWLCYLQAEPVLGLRRAEIVAHGPGAHRPPRNEVVNTFHRHLLHPPLCVLGGMASAHAQPGLPPGAVPGAASGTAVATCATAPYTTAPEPSPPSHFGQSAVRSESIKELVEAIR